MIVLTLVIGLMAMNKKGKDSQSRKWFITINNPNAKGVDADFLKNKVMALKSVVYFCFALERATTGTEHYHLFIQFATSRRFSTIQRAFGMANIQPCQGDAESNRTYIRKEGKFKDSDKAETKIDGTFYEWGTLIPERPGARTDLAAMLEMVKNGEDTLSIIDSNPSFIRYISHIEKIRSTLEKQTFSKTVRNLETVYLFGGSSSARLQFLFDKYGIEAVHRVTSYQPLRFDSYSAEEIVCFDNFNSSIPIADMINLYMSPMPLMMQSRYSDKAALYTTAVISSRYPPEDQYFNEDREDRQEFLDRLDTIIQLGDNGAVTTYTNKQYFDLGARLSKDNPFK